MDGALKNGHSTIKEIYRSMPVVKKEGDKNKWLQDRWKWDPPNKIKYFRWLVLSD